MIRLYIVVIKLIDIGDFVISELKIKLDKSYIIKKIC